MPLTCRLLASLHVAASIFFISVGFFGTLHLGLWLGVPIDANPGLICHHVSMQTLEHNRPVGFLVLVINRTPPKQCDDRVLDDVLGESS